MTETKFYKDDWISRAQDVADAMRVRGFDYVMRNNGGYLSQICSSAEIFAFLYTRAMNLGPSQAPMVPVAFPGVPGKDNKAYVSGGAYNGIPGPDQDRFIFSPAHYALVLYMALIEVGRMAPEGLEAFNKDGSTVELIGAEHSPGVETTTGSLAQALSQAGGIALGRRLKGEAGQVWVMMSDGEFQEGQTWEAIQALSHHKLDNVSVIVDVNGQQCDGPMDGVMGIDPLAAKINAFGGVAIDVPGHDLAAMERALGARQTGKPLFLLARTDPTRGVPLLKERGAALHYLRFGSVVEKEKYQAACDMMCGEGS
ncbi:transketolase [Paremcibacter congregatus]|uniref:transketolase n=1 Tax=Paremcibacter congregatus TaxID=2043170 RepID=UPI0030EEF1F2|tara:strand:- start:4397 stop:5332 length:936 start_codon:yes stop_codon:yes gene_type:complete